MVLLKKRKEFIQSVNLKPHLGILFTIDNWQITVVRAINRWTCERKFLSRNVIPFLFANIFVWKRESTCAIETVIQNKLVSADEPSQQHRLHSALDSSLTFNTLLHLLIDSSPTFGFFIYQIWTVVGNSVLQFVTVTVLCDWNMLLDVISSINLKLAAFFLTKIQENVCMFSRILTEEFHWE